MDVAEPVVVPKANVTQPGGIFVTSLVTHAATQAGDVLVVRNDHAALGGCHLLVGIEREGGSISEGTHTPPSKFAAKRLTSVLDNDEAILPGQFHDGVHIARKSKNVNRQNRLHRATGCFVYQCAALGIQGAALPQKAPELFGVDVQSYRIDVNKNRKGALVENAVG